MGYKLLVLETFVVILIISQSRDVNAASDKILCYYASWGAGRTGDGRFAPGDINPHLCTHINYAFLGMSDNGSIEIIDTRLDIDQGGLKKVSGLKTINPNLKVVISLGGYKAGTTVFRAVSADPQKRANLVKSSLDFFKTYNYDGLDIDWEYPLEGDRKNYITLLRELKEAFKPHGYILTVAVAAIPTDAAYDVPAMSNILDVINVMTYDFHTSWAGFAAQHSPLYASPREGEWQRDNLNANSSITHWILSGADPAKLAIGVAFYGHSFILSNPSQHEPGSVTSGPAPPGKFTENSGTLGYNELCAFHRKANFEWDDVQKVPYLYEGNLWVGFDDPKSAGLKAQYAKNKKLAGVMIWSIETDDLHGLCGTKYGLLQSINDNLK